jgi:hypothetical protein
MLYCVFETCKVKSVLKLYFEPFPEQINAKQNLCYPVVCVVACACVKPSGRLIRAVRLRTGRKAKMAAFCTG